MTDIAFDGSPAEFVRAAADLIQENGYLSPERGVAAGNPLYHADLGVGVGFTFAGAFDYVTYGHVLDDSEKLFQQIGILDIPDYYREAHSALFRQLANEGVSNDDELDAWGLAVQTDDAVEFLGRVADSFEVAK